MKKFLFLVRFTKQARARFLSHRDLMTVIERAVRRARLPIKFSEGFNPRPRISYLTALGLGIESLDEVIYLQLSDWLAPAEITRRLQACLPCQRHRQEQLSSTQERGLGINITRVEPILGKTLPRLCAAEYRINIPPGLNTPSEQKIQEVLKSERIMVERTKPRRTQQARLTARQVNIKPYLGDIKKVDNDLLMTLRFTQQGSTRPEEVLNTLGVPISRLAGLGICKTRSVLAPLEIPR